ncbi:TonB-dependent receptor plug domain-containing protein [Aquimarina sp. D1M17]|uniref:TonB-dependent receptor plug domain-containing protein n=1 Tax=Aquimarina acroporae TaxID=2937283 RepID=UPI0020BFBC34|nr:TonB-dependent receptor plug domain-containing protein [Aquimarina acroporae]MCK8521704.1 TonB-dependent receptor plug domain-containing protein [Aquimarina acroporae]
MIKTQIVVLLTLLNFSFASSFAQKQQDVVPLIELLNTLQEKFDCRFSYADQELEDVYTQIPSVDLELKETIDFLQNSTPFDYTVLENKNILLSLKKKKFEICGVLHSIADDTKIYGASIQIGNRATISDENGFFTLNLEKEQGLIKIKYLGFKTILIPAKELRNSRCKKLVMIPEIQYLNEIILNDYLVQGINKKSDGSVFIDYDNFGILPGLIEPDLLQTIQALPGILSVEETVSDINVRGGTNDQNLILWDGVKMYQSGHFFGLISAFNPYLTKDVQIIKNGASSSYGDGVSSVIAMNTDNTINKDTNGSLGLNMISADGYVDLNLGKKSSVQLSVRKSISEVFETPTYRQFFKKAFQDSEVVNSSTNLSNADEEFSFYDLSLRWLYQLSPKDLIKVNMLVMRNDLTFQESAEINNVNISRESSAKQNNSALGVSYHRNWSSTFRSELLLYGTNYNLEATNSDVLNNQRLLQENKVLESGLKLKTLFSLTPQLHLYSGYQFNETGISNLRDVNNPTFRDFVKEVIRTNSLFSEIEYKSDTNKTHINLGVRINHFDKFNSYTLEPRFSFNYSFDNRFTIEALGEIKSQVTSQEIESQNDFLGIENRKWVLSNEEDIPIIKSLQGSLGLTYSHKNWLVSTDVFYKNVDGITSASQGFQNQFEFLSDHGSYTVKGLDFLINKRFKSFNTWLSYSYAENKYTFSRLFAEDFHNNIDIRNNINFAISYAIKNLKLSSGLNWHSGKPTTSPISGSEILPNGEINYENPNTNTLDDYFRWDASATYSFRLSPKTNGFIGLSLWNILDQKNVVNNYYRINPSSNEVEEIEQLGLRFTPNAVVRVNF